MKLTINYGNGVVCVPAAALSQLSRADGDAVKLLLYLISTPNPTREKAAAACGCSVSAVDEALAFWCGAGLLDAERVKKEPTKKDKSQITDTEPAKQPATNVQVVDSATPSGKAALSADALPHYTTEELTALLQSRKELCHLLDECARVFGKVFNTYEVNTLLGLIDYLNLDGEYVLLLLAYCARMGKKTIRYAQRMALSLYDDGVTDVATLQECLKQREEYETAEHQIRTLFGMRSRALTAKEKKMLHAWLDDYHYGLDIITHAYELTVDATGNASVPYANSILERWNSEKLRTLEDIQAADAARGKGSTKEPAPGNSFDTDDFFTAALQRSYGEDYVPATDKKSKAK